MGVGAIYDVLRVGQTGTMPRDKGPVKRTEVREPAVRGPITREQMKRAVEELIRDFASNKSVRMYFDDAINKVVVTVMDEDAQTVIRQIPAPEFIAFAKRFSAYLGMVIERKV
jgi:uncharacterized FlaG/YvyC family protein